MMIRKLAGATSNSGTAGTIMNATHDKKVGTDIEVTVKSQRGKFQRDFAPTDTVRTVITAAVSVLGFDPSDQIDLVLQNDRANVIPPDTVLGTLGKQHDEGNNKDKLMFVLTAIGTGV